MTDWSRRAFLASGVAGLSAVAGCSSIPVLGESDDHPSYDYQRLHDLADPESVPEPSMYPAPVSAELADTHYEHGRNLLAGVPSAPSFPNEVVTYRLSDMRERAEEAFAEPPGDVSTVDALSGWRHDRGTAAEVRAAYDAASGDLTRAGVDDLRSTVREEVSSFRDDWTYRGGSVLEATAVHWQLERLVGASRRSLAETRRLPEDLRTAVFDAGQVVGDLEEGLGAVGDATGLRDTYVTDGMAAHVEDISIAASRLEGVLDSTRHSVGPDIDGQSGIDDFSRDLEETPAAELFRVARGTAGAWAADRVDVAIERGDYATAVTDAGRALVDVIAAGNAVSAIRDGDHEPPASTDEISDIRTAAFGAVDDLLSAEPGPVEVIVSWPARRTLRDAESELAGLGYEADNEDWTPDYRDVIRAVGRYAYATYAADAVPSVVDRVVTELETP